MIGNLAFLCIILVCVVHVGWTASTELGQMLVYLSRSLLPELAVSFFYIVSGYFLARHFGEPGWWKTAVLKRLRTLMIPYFVWATVNVALVYANTGSLPGRGGGYALSPFSSPDLIPLWYLRCLMVLVALSPLVWLALKRFGKSFLAAAFAANLLLGVLLESGVITEHQPVGMLLCYTLSPLGLFYFSLGAYLSHNPVTLSRRAGTLCGAAALALLAVRLVLFHFKIVIPFNLCALIAPAALAFLWTRTPATPLPAFLTRAVFPIFLMHVLFFKQLRYLGLGAGTLGQWMILVLGIVLSIAVSEILHRFFPRVAYVVFGGR